MHIENFISSLDFFSSLQDDELKLLISLSSVKSYTKDYVLTYEKEKSPSLLFLLKGLVKAYKIDKYNNEIFLHYIYAPSLISDISTVKDDFLTSFANISIFGRF